jgi:phosphoribulokinase
MKRAGGQQPHFSHFGPEANLLEELGDLFKSPMARPASGKVRKYLHDAEEAEPYGQQSGEFTPWQDIPADTDLMFYEGLHGACRQRHDRHRAAGRPAASASCRRSTSNGSRSCTATRTSAATRQRRSRTPSCAACPTTSTTSRPQFSRTHVNFQRVPTVDTSNPFIARDIPTADESFVVIRFANSKGIDFPYLLSMIHNSFMSRPNTSWFPAARWNWRCRLIFTPLILRMIENRKRA